MSLSYNRHYANNDQRGHQIYHDQVLQKYPISGASYANNSGEYIPGGYQADGSVAMWGKKCNVRLTNQYSMPTCCSTWAGACNHPVEYCPCGPAGGPTSTVLPPEVDTSVIKAAELHAALGGK